MEHELIISQCLQLRSLIIRTNSTVNNSKMRHNVHHTYILIVITISYPPVLFLTYITNYHVHCCSVVNFNITCKLIWTLYFDKLYLIGKIQGINTHVCNRLYNTDCNTSILCFVSSYHNYLPNLPVTALYGSIMHIIFYWNRFRVTRHKVRTFFSCPELIFRKPFKNLVHFKWR